MNAAINQRRQNVNRTNRKQPTSVSHKKLIRLFFFLLAIVVSFSCGAIFKSYASAQDTSSAPLAFHAETVKSVDVVKGDTLLKIAREHAPKDANIHAYVDKIKKLNGLKNAMLQEGQILELP
ncbi:LysM peptidoglycan-binding domain-containing protein [Paenibacillus sp. MBLB4367]|uniref:LysM peptidoglycan-binding domain-containing protein n=1 Tax=Paenibacillus sp. MBLB4367 TaxID=3384767 RepID=UPI0039080740